VLDRFLHTDIGEIRIFSRDEKKQDDMRKKYNASKLKFHLGDVRDLQSVNNVVNGVDYIFHAAALKQVPSCEFFPLEAIKTNVLGAENVLESGINHNVKKIVVLSTDKAVYPVNAMGMSKALMEKVMIARSRNITNDTTVVCGTRYGNVMASRGSVIPLFIEQLKTGRELTVTNPEMTRFMMSLANAVNLVLFAFEHGNQGDIFVQKAPACTLETLTRALRELYGKDNGVRIIGTRHGEKLYEALVSREDMVKAEEMGDYFRIPADTRNLNYNLYFSDGETRLTAAEEYNSHNTERLNLEKTKELLLGLETVRNDLGAR
ncbi:MAG: polysaccharide biosynthesis protein, partial [Victivallales bacterium]|nr:polysaccharide biosynthesis protein [Victivallales bacterium]